MKPGDTVKIETKDNTFEGILMPNEETEAVVIKLESGYNIGIDKKKITSTKVLSKFSQKESKEKNIPKNAKLPKVSIIHTGGTIASKVNYETGGVISRFSPAELVEVFPEMKKIANLDSYLIEQMFSEDMRFEHYQKIAKAIKKELEKDVKGIIVTHGTDTICYTAAALAFMFENISIPIILVGAQRSSDRGSSDAAMNLICATEFIAQSDFAGVAICMHDNLEDKSCAILPATKTRKMHTSRRDAFQAIDDEPIALVNFESRKVTFQKEYSKKSEDKLVIKDKMEDKVGMIKCHPNMFAQQFDFFKDYKGLVIEGTGMGHAPIDPPNKLNTNIGKSIKKLVEGGTIVVMTSQCIFGPTHPHVYTAGVNLSKMGVIYVKDTLPETAFIKLSWLLGNEKDPDKVKQLLQENLRGEINGRIEPDQFLK